MLVEQTMEKLVAMKLTGMAEELRRWMEKPKEKDLSPLDLVGLLADAEWRHREQRKLTARLRTARFRQDACVEDIDYQHARGLTKTVMLDLATCRWVDAHQNVIFSGLTGVGKSYLACALGQKACREGYTVVYRRASRLLDEISQARADGSQETATIVGTDRYADININSDCDPHTEAYTYTPIQPVTASASYSAASPLGTALRICETKCVQRLGFSRTQARDL